jgi:hypothetical protein
MTIAQSACVPLIPRYQVAPPTKEDCKQIVPVMGPNSNSSVMIVDYADLVIIDLSKFSTSEGRAELATLARDAMRTHGFLYVINHGFTTEQVFILSL